jgi:Fur family ferric uptake transcriptional regulator
MLDLAPSGFVVERHELTLYGQCAACVEQAKASAPAA